MKPNSRPQLSTNTSLKKNQSSQCVSPTNLQQKSGVPTVTSFRSPISQIFQQSKKSFHSHKNSQVEISNLSKLILKQKQDSIHLTPSQTSLKQSLSQSQMAQLIQKAKEMNQQFKNNQYFQSVQSPTHLRHESTGGQLSPTNQQLLVQQHHQKLATIANKQQLFMSHSNLKEIINQKKQSLHSQNNSKDQNQPFGKNTFNFQYVIGIGGFGKVWKVEQKKTRQTFAMKEMSKALVISKKSVNSVINERNLLSSLKHPFLVNMHYSFHDKENLYLVMDYMAGGDLRYHIGKMRTFTEEQTKFFIACIFVGLEYLHSNNIIQRDIKPENLVLDDKGYVRITDMGIARAQKSENSSDTSGTPGYMAPEVMCRLNHSFPVDYFALGVIGYEFMIGRRPYLGRSRQEIREQILAKQVQIRKSDIPDGWSVEAADFINRLIQRKPQNRLGFTGPHEIKLHPWFKSFPWSKLLKGELKSPYIPNIYEDNFDQKQIVIEDEENAELIQQNILILRDNNVQDLFGSYEYTGQIQSPSTTETISGYISHKHTRTTSSQSKIERYIFEH